MATELTKAILIEIVDMLQMINKTILELTEDILRDETIIDSADPEEAEAKESTYWSNLYGRTAAALQAERLHAKDLQERVHQLETQLFKSMV